MPGHKVSYGKVAFASFCAYSLSHNLGFAAVSGAAVRYRLYAHWGLTPLQIAKVVAFCSLTFGLGGMVLGGIILFVEPRGGAVLRRPPAALGACTRVGAALWVIVARLCDACPASSARSACSATRSSLPGWRMAIVQVLLATVDVAVTAAIFYRCCRRPPGLTFCASSASMSRPTRRGSRPICRAGSACSTPPCCSA